MSLGYIALVAIFVGMVVGCFAFAISELARPRDPGPLPIDVRRDINHRYFARHIRRQAPPAQDIVGGGSHSGRVPDVDCVVPLRLEAGSTIGNTFGPRHVLGDGAVSEGSHVDSFVCDGVATIGEGALVAEHAEGLEELIISAGAVVRGRATSPQRIVLAPASAVRSAAAPYIRTSGLPACEVPATIPAWDPQLDADFDWLASLGTPLDRAFSDIELTAGTPVDAHAGLLRYEQHTLRPTRLLDLAGALAPSWLGSMKGWYLGAATVRFPGDVEIPQDALVPFSVIVEGALLAHAGVRFAGSIHASGDVVLGDESRVVGSVTAGGHVVLGDDVIVDGCVAARFDAYVGSRVWVGGERDGGLSAGRAAEIGFGTVIRHRLFAETGAVVRPLPSESLIFSAV
ncbi:MAG: hypothetical protein NVSMB57_10640 [Actinomycetota bacterium]